jgi:diguanylate cyclase (GGDEF)-like protein/PAS domain S-box-containing protein
MKRLTPVWNVSFGLVLLTVSLLLLGDLIGLVPDAQKGLLEGRGKFSESLAVQFSIAFSRGDSELIKATLDTMVARDDEILSAAIRNVGGRVFAQAGNHDKNWIDIPLDKSTATHVQVPIFNGNRRMGTVEVVFERPQGSANVFGFGPSLATMVVFLTLTCFFAFLFFLKKTLRELDPRSVIPERVKSAFNALAEGLVIIDEKEQILLANTAFSDKIEVPADTLLGRKLSYLNWIHDGNKNQQLPWDAALANEKYATGVPMKYETRRSGMLTFMVNTSPITDAKGAIRGALATFDDLTDLESKQVQLRHTIDNLNQSKKELQEKTVELEYLATRDSLTGCLNRRAFFEKAELLYLEAIQNGTDMSCIMIDIDHFKSINDQFGHAVGDKVIQLVTGELRANARPDDVVGRYGGEEFCILLPGVASADTVTIAERLRVKVKNATRGRVTAAVRVTASFGVAEINADIPGLTDLVNLADKALYIAKEKGRNRVIAWEGDCIQEPCEDPGRETQGEIAYPSVTDESLVGDPQAFVNASDGVPGDEELHSLQARISGLEEELAYSQEVLIQQEGQDPVTGLPNRLLFRDRVSQALAHSQRNECITAVIVLDIDMFRRINDALGFVIGDQLLKKTSERLLEVLRNTDTVALMDGDMESSTVSRTGADEFGVLLTDLNDVKMITWIVKRILDEMALPLEIDGHEIFMTCSAGISLFPYDGNDPDILLLNANSARYNAKQRFSRNNFTFYSENLNQSSFKQLWFEGQLHHAMELGELSLQYQPKVDLISGKITSMEALIRWNNPKLGFVSPLEFIPVAEHTGLIHEIGAWVVHTACTQARRWKDAGFEDLSVAVNVSAIQFRKEDLHERIITMVAEAGLEPRNLEVEITETVVMENHQAAIHTINELAKAGMGISIDDFGTGYSSLSYLKHLPVSTLKIDRSFLTGTVPDKQDELIITAIIAMAHSMDLTVVAEGVENRSQKDFLAGLKCDEMQGYLFSKPVDPDAALELLRIHNTQDVIEGGQIKSA